MVAIVVSSTSRDRCGLIPTQVSGDENQAVVAALDVLRTNFIRHRLWSPPQVRRLCKAAPDPIGRENQRITAINRQHRRFERRQLVASDAAPQKNVLPASIYTLTPLWA